MPEGDTNKPFRLGTWLVQPSLNRLSDGDRVVTADHDVIRNVLLKLARGSLSELRFEPGGIEEANERERGDDQEHHNAIDQDDDAEDAAEIAGEGNVPESEGAHDREGPVEPGDP